MSTDAIRRDIGRVKHLATSFLGAQDHVTRRKIMTKKLYTSATVWDILTKAVPSSTILKMT